MMEMGIRGGTMPYDNVIIFGAGASYDAGIPLLKDFVDTMWG